MSAPAATAPPYAPTGRDESRVTWLRAARGEAIRFTALRSNQWAMLGALASTAALGSMEAAFWTEDEAFVPGVGHTVVALSGLIITQLVVAVVGALSMTSEYSHGSIVTSTLAVPRRSWTLTAKAVVLAAVVFPVTAAGGVISFLATGALLEARGQPVQALTDAGVAGSILGSAAYLTAVALIGLGVGAMIRSTAGSVAIVTGGLYALPELARIALPAAWYDTAGQYLPAAAGEALWSPVDTDALLSAPVGAAVLAAWVLGILVTAAVVTVRRDV